MQYCFQKEVKTRVQYVVEVLGKIEAGLKMPIIDNETRIKYSGSPKEERRVRRMSPDRDGHVSKERNLEERKIHDNKMSPRNNSNREPREDQENKRNKRKVCAFILLQIR